MKPLAGPRCETCLTEHIGVGARYCLRCQSKPPAYAKLLALYDYRPPFSDVIRALKFRRLAYLADEFAFQLWDRYAEELAKADLVVPLPAPWLRLLRRGFNQAEAIADPLAKRLGVPVLSALQRSHGPPLSSFERQADRRRNVRETLHLRRQFRSRSRDRPKRAAVTVPKGTLFNRRVLLVDDLVTSGTTAQRASILLRQAGASQVVVAAAGHLL